MAHNPIVPIVLDPGVRHMVRKPVNSTNVKSVGYDPFCMLAEVEFHSGGVYQYFPVSRSEFAALMEAPSKGSHLSREFVPHKDCRRVVHQEIADPHEAHQIAAAEWEGMVPTD